MKILVDFNDIFTTQKELPAMQCGDPAVNVYLISYLYVFFAFVNDNGPFIVSNLPSASFFDSSHPPYDPFKPILFSNS